ncbi:hypothetical protein [Rhodoferax lacus]|uniref:hypothetical protein n=1 Tax=Rhodoferax lacus TaxID=2184758 RepID=UPI000E3D944D|nr:hypothetical protein [Rhodoferax lacus]
MESEKSNHKNINNITIGIVGLAAAIGAFLAPPNLKDKIEGLAMYGSQERTCYREYVGDLKDPYSAYLVESRVLVRPKGFPNFYPVLEKFDEAIQITIASKNGFGAYTKQQFQCPTRNGIVDTTDTHLWQLQSERL